MARFIVIECATGRVYGDTAKLGMESDVGSPVDALHRLDRNFGRVSRSFGYVGPQSSSAVYNVYELPSHYSIDESMNELETLKFAVNQGSLAASIVSYSS